MSDTYPYPHPYPSPSNIGEDTFGAKDEDWQLYKLMSKDNDDDDDGADEEEAELARVCSRLQVDLFALACIDLFGILLIIM